MVKAFHGQRVAYSAHSLVGALALVLSGDRLNE